MGLPADLADNDIDRFWSRVDRQAGDACWIWTAGGRGGYGTFFLGGKMHGAHRVAYRIARGPIPNGLHVCHRCDNPPCVRPDHLFLGTNHENQLDKCAKGRLVTRFQPGHAFLTPPERLPRGERVHCAKLTADDVRRIRRMRAEGRAGRAIARLFGVSETAIRRVVSGRTWAHVPILDAPTDKEVEDDARRLAE